MTKYATVVEQIPLGLERHDNRSVGVPDISMNLQQQRDWHLWSVRAPRRGLELDGSADDYGSKEDMKLNHPVASSAVHDLDRSLRKQLGTASC